MQDGILAKCAYMLLSVLHIYAYISVCYTIIRGEYNMGGKNSPESINRYISKTYDRINLTVPKGQKDMIKAHAEARGESVNGFIGRAISETIDRDNGAE